MRFEKFFASLLVAVVAPAGVSRAISYDFLPVAQTGTFTSQYTSNNGNGTINVTDSFSPGGAGPSENINTAIYPSSFTTLFPGTGLVQGHLAQTVYNHTSLVEFDLVNYSLSGSTVFGVWNMTNEVTPPPGGNPVYRLEILDASLTVLPLTGMNIIGNQDNQTQVQGQQNLDLNLGTGEFSPGASINGGVGTHTNAIFMDNLPATARYIRVYGDLPPLNLIGDGVGYYFAEVVPEPASLGMFAMAFASGCLMRRRSR
jgi:hypothetical protein